MDNEHLELDPKPDPESSDVLEACEKEKQEYLEGWRRAKAELLNYKKDEAKRMGEWRDRIEDEILYRFLAVMDSFKFALNGDYASKLPEEALRGFGLIESQAFALLKQFGVERFGAIGEPFDPSRHEAVLEVEDSQAPPGGIAEVLQAGYERNGQILRPARVKVKKLEPENSDDNQIDIKNNG